MEYWLISNLISIYKCLTDIALWLMFVYTTSDVYLTPIV